MHPFWIIVTVLEVLEVVDTESWVTSNLPFLLDPSSIGEIQFYSPTAYLFALVGKKLR